MLGLAVFMITMTYGFGTFARGGGPVGDYGDAPDSAEPKANFPSLFASNGAHVKKINEVWLGQTVSREKDSVQTGDSGDDGVSLDLNLCDESQAYVLVHVGKIEETSGKAYLNMFFDWNADGQWSSSAGCADEWALKNYEIDLSQQDGEVAIYTPSFTAGQNIDDIWYRAVLTLNQKMNGADGTGEFESGEIEDYGPLAAPNLPPDKNLYSARCEPAVLIVKHGEGGEFTVVENPGSQTITQAELANNVNGNTAERDIGKDGEFAFYYESNQKDPPKRIVNELVDVRVRFGQKASKTIKCSVAVVHDDDFEPPPPPEGADDDEDRSSASDEDNEDQDSGDENTGPEEVSEQEKGLYNAQCSPSELVLKHGDSGGFKIQTLGSQEYYDLKINKENSIGETKDALPIIGDIQWDPRFRMISIFTKKDGPKRIEKRSLAVDLFFKNVQEGGPDKKLTVYCKSTIYHDNKFVAPPQVPIDDSGGTTTDSQGRVVDTNPVLDNERELYSAQCNPNELVLKHGDNGSFRIENQGSQDYYDMKVDSEKSIGSTPGNTLPILLDPIDDPVFRSLMISSKKDPPKRIEKRTIVVQLLYKNVNPRQTDKKVNVYCFATIHHDDSFTNQPQASVADGASTTFEEKWGKADPLLDSEKNIYSARCNPGELALKHGDNGSIDIESTGQQEYYDMNIDRDKSINASGALPSIVDVGNDTTFKRIDVHTKQDGPKRIEKETIVVQLLFKNLNPRQADKKIYLYCFATVHHDDRFVAPPQVPVADGASTTFEEKWKNAEPVYDNENGLYSAQCNPATLVLKHGDIGSFDIQATGSQDYYDMQVDQANSTNAKDILPIIPDIENDPTFRKINVFSKKDSPKRVEKRTIAVQLLFNNATPRSPAKKLYVYCFAEIHHDNSFTAPPPVSIDFGSTTISSGAGKPPVAVTSDERKFYDAKCSPGELDVNHGEFGSIDIINLGTQDYSKMEINKAKSSGDMKNVIPMLVDIQNDTTFRRLVVYSVKDPPNRIERRKIAVDLTYKNIKPGEPDKKLTVNCYVVIHHDDKYTPPQINIGDGADTTTGGKRKPPVAVSNDEKGIYNAKCSPEPLTVQHGDPASFTIETLGSEEYYDLKINEGKSTGDVKNALPILGDLFTDPRFRTILVFSKKDGPKRTEKRTIAVDLLYKNIKPGEPDKKQTLYCKAEIKHDVVTGGGDGTTTGGGGNVGTTGSGTAKQISFISDPQKIMAGHCSDAVMVQKQDANGVKVTSGPAVYVNLASTPAGVSFYSDPYCSQPITQASIRPNICSTYFYFKTDENASGNYWIAVSATGIGSSIQKNEIIKNDAAGMLYTPMDLGPLNQMNSR